LKGILVVQLTTVDTIVIVIAAIGQSALMYEKIIVI